MKINAYLSNQNGARVVSNLKRNGIRILEYGYNGSGGRHQFRTKMNNSQMMLPVFDGRDAMYNHTIRREILRYAANGNGPILALRTDSFGKDDISNIVNEEIEFVVKKTHGKVFRDKNEWYEAVRTAKRVLEYGHKIEFC